MKNKRKWNRKNYFANKKKVINVEIMVILFMYMVEEEITVSIYYLPILQKKGKKTILKN